MNWSKNEETLKTFCNCQDAAFTQTNTELVVREILSQKIRDVTIDLLIKAPFCCSINREQSLTIGNVTFASQNETDELFAESNHFNKEARHQHSQSFYDTLGTEVQISNGREC